MTAIPKYIIRLGVIKHRSDPHGWPKAVGQAPIQDFLLDTWIIFVAARVKVALDTTVNHGVRSNSRRQPVEQRISISISSRRRGSSAISSFALSLPARPLAAPHKDSAGATRGAVMQ
ncbi:hypothetical protein RRG08_017244 [Elysia crispata]|uniref:Uncharacterized protein n=1 Tax=Elysia crispata TaxID=231223 RepID=A0AAE0XT89_9GAST|nr:hypothetical protein RRG08_017244 [Elysia crispata]